MPGLRAGVRSAWDTHLQATVSPVALTAREIGCDFTWRRAYLLVRSGGRSSNPPGATSIPVSYSLLPRRCQSPAGMAISIITGVVSALLIDIPLPP